MADFDKKIHDYLQQAQIMQLATVRAERPWIATVYFVHDAAGNLYWLSWPSRRHSQDIAAGSSVAVAIAVKTNLPVIGLQAEGQAEQVDDAATIEAVMPRYIAKYGAGQDFYANFTNGTNRHSMYRFVPKEYILFTD